MTRHDTSVERTNIDAKFESCGRHNSQDPAVAQPTFDLAPFPRKISSAIAADRSCLAWLRRIRLLQVGEQNLRMQPAVGKDNRLQLPGKQFLGYACALVDIASPNAKVPVDHRRIVENAKLLPGLRAIIFDHFHFLFDEL